MLQMLVQYIITRKCPPGKRGPHVRITVYKTLTFRLPPDTTSSAATTAAAADDACRELCVGRDVYPLPDY